MAEKSEIEILRETGIHTLCQNGDNEGLSTLLASYEDPGFILNYHNKEGLIPIHWALLYANPLCVRVLINYGSDLSMRFDGLPVLILATSLGGFEAFRAEAHGCVTELLEAQSIRVDDNDRMGRTAMHCCAVAGMAETITLLLTKEASARIRDFEGNLPIHTCIEYNQAGCLRVLLNELGSDSFAEANGSGDLLCHIAIRVRAWSCLTVLIEMGTEEVLKIPNEEGETPEQVAEACGYTEEYASVIRGEDLANIQQTLVITHDICREHASLSEEDALDPRLVVEQRKFQPENPYRIDACRKTPYGALMTDEFADTLLWILEPPRANAVDILRVHEAAYYSRIEELIMTLPEDKIKLLDSDTSVTHKSWEAAFYAAGAVTNAVDNVMKGQNRNAFCLVRPPGHHSGPTGAVASELDRSQTSNGFCIFNNIAIGAAYAKWVYREIIKKVAIIDFDVHHGNGTQEIVENLNLRVVKDSFAATIPLVKLEYHFYKPWLNEDDSKNVLFISSHGFGHASGKMFYPASGEEVKEDENLPGGILNIPLEFGTDSSMFRKVYREKVFPRLVEFSPDFIFISAGFDAHVNDDINNHMTGLDENDYKWVTDELCKIANLTCEGRIVSALEGGYRIQGGISSAFAQSVAAHIRSLKNASFEKFKGNPAQEVREEQFQSLKRKAAEDSELKTYSLRKKPKIDWFALENVKSVDLGIADSPTVDINIPAFEDVDNEPTTLAELMGEVHDDENME